MNWTNWFHSQKEDTTSPNSSDIKKMFGRMIDHIGPVSPFTTFNIFSNPFSRGQKMSDIFRQLPLEKRIDLLVDTERIQDCFQEMVDKELGQIRQEKLADALKKHPELTGKINLNNIRFTVGAINQIKERVAEMFISTLFTPEEVKEASLNLISPQKTLSQPEQRLLKIYMSLWKHNVPFLDQKYGVDTDAFQAMIAKGAMDLADIMGETLKQDPRSILRYGVACCCGSKGFDRGEMALNVDSWVAKWLNPKMIKALLPAHKLVPLEGAKTDKPAWNEIRQTQRYQSSFKIGLMFYFFQSPTVSQKVFQMAFPYISKTDPSIQEQMWHILFKKYETDPSIRNDVVQCITSFLAQTNDQEALKTMYGMFVKSLPADKRADLLGHLSTASLKKYFNTFSPIRKNIPYIPVQTDTDKTFLAWHLFHEKVFNIDQMKKILASTNPKEQRSFLFSPKKQMDKDLFAYMCGVFAQSTFYFWQWVRSFKDVPDFKASLAEIYLKLPPSVRENKGYVIAMDNHFELVRQCALKGDTASLSALKKVLSPDVFWRSLTLETEGQISGIRALCEQGKRGLLKLIADWPAEKQQALFMTTGATGRTLLADCADNFGRLVTQNVFKQAYQKVQPVKSIEPPRETPTVLSEAPKLQPAPEKPKRQIIKIPVFESQMEQIATNSKLVQDVTETMDTLSRMSKAEMAMELREGWRHRGILDKAPCAVKDIRGNNYRLGYLLQGDVEQGTGKIAFLFILTHAQYDTFLAKQADQAVRVATAMMNANPATPATPTFPGPTGPWGGNDGR